MKEDKAIDRIREARHRISEACDHDPRKLIDYYKELQKKHKARLIEHQEELEESESLVKAEMR